MKKESHFNGKDPEELFSEIYKKCKKLAITLDDFSKLSAIKKLKTKNYFKRKKVLFFVLAAFFLICALLISVGRDSLIIYFVKIWFFFGHYDINKERCLFRMTSKMQSFFASPFNCSVCRNLSTIERVTNISHEDFVNRFAFTGIPVIVTDGASNWKAKDTFSFEFFKQLYFDRQAQGDFKWECQFFEYKTEFSNLSDALSMSPERFKQPWYFGWNNCDDMDMSGILREHMHLPYFLPPYLPFSVVDWIFMGTPGYGAHLHLDHVDVPSWQAQLKGRKLWTLQPQPECYSECFHSIEVVINPGEIILVQTNLWYHKTEVIGDEISIAVGSEYYPEDPEDYNP